MNIFMPAKRKSWKNQGDIMPNFITIIYLVFMFIALYFFSFFILLTIRNKKDLFSFPNPKEDFSISILIPAYNEEDSIAETISRVLSSDYPKDKLEVIVINDGSKDNTGKIIEELTKKHQNLKLIDKPNSGKANSLNIAINQAKGDLIAIVDSDSFPEQQSLKKLTGFFADPKMGAVTSFVWLRNKDESFLTKIQSIEYLLLGWSRKLFDFINSVWCTNGPLSLYRKEYILKVGGFDPNTVTEDIDITWNLLNHGYKTGMCLDARVTTIAPSKFKEWYRQRTRWGLGGLQAIKKYKKMFFKRGMFGAFILPFISFSIILSIATFLFSSYLIFKSIITRVLITSYSISTDSAIFTTADINLYPSVIIFYFIVLLILSLSYSSFVIKNTKYEIKLTTKKLFTMLFYLLAYLMLYPIVWFSSILRFIKKDYKW